MKKVNLDIFVLFVISALGQKKNKSNCKSKSHLTFSFLGGGGEFLRGFSVFRYQSHKLVYEADMR